VWDSLDRPGAAAAQPLPCDQSHLLRLGLTPAACCRSSSSTPCWPVRLRRCLPPATCCGCRCPLALNGNGPAQGKRSRQVGFAVFQPLLLRLKRPARRCQWRYCRAIFAHNLRVCASNARQVRRRAESNSRSALRNSKPIASSWPACRQGQRATNKPQPGCCGQARLNLTGEHASKKIDSASKLRVRPRRSRSEN